MYVADQVNDAIYVYNNVPNASPTRVITTGLNIPLGLNVDSNGDLFVANYGANTVLEFAPGGSTPIRVYSTGLSGPDDVKVSLAGEVYVTNFNGGDVVVYPPGSTVPAFTWHSPIPSSLLLGIALQTPDYAPGGDVYVSYEAPGGSGLLWCPVETNPGGSTPGSATCFSAGVGVASFSWSLAFQYNTFPLMLVVSEQTANGLDVFRLHHGTSPTAQLPMPGSPNGVAFDRGFTHLFVADDTSSSSGTNGVLNETTIRAERSTKAFCRRRP